MGTYNLPEGNDQTFEQDTTDNIGEFHTSTLGQVNSTKGGTETTLENNGLEKITTPKPSPKEFMNSLRTSNPQMFKELLEKIQRVKRPKTKANKDYLEADIGAIFKSPSLKRSKQISNQSLGQKNYKSSALLSNGELVEYDLILNDPNNIEYRREDAEFLGYGVFWDAVER